MPMKNPPHPGRSRLHSYNVHRFGGDSKAFWLVKKSGNLRLIFRFKDGEAFDVDLIDTH